MFGSEGMVEDLNYCMNWLACCSAPYSLYFWYNIQLIASLKIGGNDSAHFWNLPPYFVFVLLTPDEIWTGHRWANYCVRHCKSCKFVDFTIFPKVLCNIFITLFKILSTIPLLPPALTSFSLSGLEAYVRGSMCQILGKKVTCLQRLLEISPSFLWVGGLGHFVDAASKGILSPSQMWPWPAICPLSSPHWQNTTDGWKRTAACSQLECSQQSIEGFKKPKCLESLPSVITIHASTDFWNLLQWMEKPT